MPLSIKVCRGYKACIAAVRVCVCVATCYVMLTVVAVAQDLRKWFYVYELTTLPTL